MRWIQLLVNDHQELLDADLRSRIGIPPDQAIEWRSPRRDDNYAEYRDAAFVARCDVHLKVSLGSFWPRGGPQWDALAVTDKQGPIIVVEAKAHLSELVSPPTRASGQSLARISAALDEAKQHFGVEHDRPWTGQYYQYANRLAHLYFLRERNGIDAHLLFIYFVGDSDHALGICPRSSEEWQPAIKRAHDALGIAGRSIPAVHELFVDVRMLG